MELPAGAHAPYNDLRDKIAAYAKEIGIGSEYVHYKNPVSSYRVLGMVVLETNDVIAVRYASVSAPDVEFARPYTEWVEEVEVDGQRLRRFTRVS